MFALISYPMGVVAECLILGGDRNQMRIVLPGAPDTIDLDRRNGEWFTREGCQVNLEFVSMVDESQTAASDVRVMAAGSWLG